MLDFLKGISQNAAWDAIKLVFAVALFPFIIRWYKRVMSKEGKRQAATASVSREPVYDFDLPQWLLSLFFKICGVVGIVGFYSALSHLGGLHDKWVVGNLILLPLVTAEMVFLFLMSVFEDAGLPPETRRQIRQTPFKRRFWYMVSTGVVVGIVWTVAFILLIR